MKKDLYSNEWISDENQSTEIILQAHREEVFLIVSLKTVFEHLNLVKRYDYTNPNVFVLSLWEKYRRGLTSFGQYISHDFHLCFLFLSIFDVCFVTSHVASFV